MVSFRHLQLFIAFDIVVAVVVVIIIVVSIFLHRRLFSLDFLSDVHSLPIIIRLVVYDH